MRKSLYLHRFYDTSTLLFLYLDERTVKIFREISTVFLLFDFLLDLSGESTENVGRGPNIFVGGGHYATCNRTPPNLPFLDFLRK